MYLALCRETKYKAVMCFDNATISLKHTLDNVTENHYYVPAVIPLYFKTT